MCAIIPIKHNPAKLVFATGMQNKNTRVRMNNGTYSVIDEKTYMQREESLITYMYGIDHIYTCGIYYKTEQLNKYLRKNIHSVLTSKWGGGVNNMYFKHTCTCN